MALVDTVAQAYRDLQTRLAKNPVGAPPADELFEIFQILFTEEVLKKMRFVRNYARRAYCPNSPTAFLGGRTPKLHSPAKPCE